MSNYKGEIDGEEVTTSFWPDPKKPKFYCRHLFDSKDFDSEEAIERAIKTYKLSLRKDFSNSTAYIRESGYEYERTKIVAVKVTSVINEKDAWVVQGKDRRKVERDRLFDSMEEANDALTLQKECDKKVKAAWKAVKRWEPKK